MTAVWLKYGCPLRVNRTYIPSRKEGMFVAEFVELIEYRHQ